MKIILIVIIQVILTISMSISQNKKPLSPILEYYYKIPEFTLENSFPEKDIIKRREHILKNFCTVLDEKNAYLKLEDTISELPRTLELTYFKSSDGVKTIAVFEIAIGGDCDSYTMSFYNTDGYMWLKVNDEVLPQFSFRKNFWGKNDKLPTDKYMDIDANLNWHYELPRFGTTIKVYPVGLGEGICFNDTRLSGIEEFGNIENRETFLYKTYPQTIESRKFKYLELKWNKEKGVFELGNSVEH